MNESPEEQPERDLPGKTPPNPLGKPGQRMTLGELFEHVPPADANLMRDVDAAQNGLDLPR